MNSKGKIGIIGSGLIGSSWALLFASAGYEVKLYDNDKNQLKAAINTISLQLEKLSSQGLLRGNLTATQQLSLITDTLSIKECIKDCLYIQECVPENLDFKLKVFKEIDENTSPKTILASSVSCIVPSKFTSELKNRSNCIVAHPVNPPYFVPLVEIVPAPWTSPDVVSKTKDLMKEIGQSPVVFSKEHPGFALNRIQYAILNECFNLAQEGILSVEDVDTVMKEGLAPRYIFMGPLETAHLNAPKGFHDYLERYSSTIESVSKTMKHPKWSVEDGQCITDQLESKISVDDLKSKIIERDEKLVAFSTFKEKLP